MAIWQVNGDTAADRIKSAMYFVTTLNIPYGTAAGQAAVEFLALASEALEPVQIDAPKETDVGRAFRRLIQLHVRDVGEAWRALDETVDAIIAEADAKGEPTWDVTLHVKGATLENQIRRQLMNLQNALGIASSMDEGEAKILASLATLFPAEALITDLLCEWIVANPSKDEKLKKIVKKHVKRYVNLRWSSRIDIDLEWVRNAFGHGQAELTYAGLKLAKSRTCSDEALLNANQLLEYPRVAAQTWTAYQMKALFVMMLDVAKER